MAQETTPLQTKKLHAESILALQSRNIRSNRLPRIQVGAQASWQSDVFGLPFKFPGSEIPEVPRDQYRLTADVAQKIWDGGADRYLREQRELEKDVAATQVDVEAFSTREIVTDLFFRALLIQENEQIIGHALHDLEARLKQAEAAVREGVALLTSADQIRIQILKNRQIQNNLRSDKETLMQILALWIGRQESDLVLKYDPSPVVFPEPSRPEHRLFDLQQKSLQVSKSALSVRMLPKFEAFAQGGLGSPNPFNFFETSLEPFVQIGLRAVWTPIDWGNKNRETQILDYQIKNLDAQRQFFDIRLRATSLKDREDEQKWTNQLAQDDDIITLQTDIICRADAQVKNGVMTMTDFLAQMDLLTQAQLTRKTHEIQAVQAREIYLAKMGD
jgi:outer membrane protein TolC